MGPFGPLLPDLYPSPLLLAVARSGGRGWGSFGACKEGGGRVTREGNKHVLCGQRHSTARRWRGFSGYLTGGSAVPMTESLTPHGWICSHGWLLRADSAD